MQEQPTRNKQSIQQLYEQVLPALAQQVHQSITPVTPLFDNFSLERLIDTWTKDPAADDSDEISVENGNVQQLGLKLRLEGFQRAGVEAFDITKSILFRLERNNYTVGPNPHTLWLEKEYLQRWEQSEYKLVAEKFSEELIDELTQRLEDLAQ